LWTLDGVARPAALASTGNQLVVLLSDGRILWVNAETGQIEATSLVWSGLLEEGTVGEIYTDGQSTLVIAAQELLAAGDTQAPSRTRLVVFDAGGNEQWFLEDTDGGHRYTAILLAGTVIVGQWSPAGRDNHLLAYDMQTGSEVWSAAVPTPTPTPSPEPTLRPTPAPTTAPPPEIIGYRLIRLAGDTLYALIDTVDGPGVAAYDPFTGVEKWRWLDASARSPFVQLAISEDGLVAGAADRLLLLDPQTGQPRWQASLALDPEAGLALVSGVVPVAPAPTADFDFRPGIIGLQVADGNQTWHVLSGLLAESLGGGDDTLWAIVKEFDQGEVFLVGLYPASGAEVVRLPAGDHPEASYRLVAQGRRLYVLGPDLRAFGY
jgi:outer membrane protein assembly factor BamB